MKTSLAISFLILALAAGIGWQDEHRLASSRERHAKAVKQAAALGISLNSTQDNDSVVITKRERKNPQEDAQRAIAAFIAMVKEADDIEKSGGKVEAAIGRKIMERLTALSVTEGEILVSGILDGNELDGEYREGFISISMLKLANNGPQTALKLLPRLTGVFHDPEDEQKCREAVLNTSLTAWSREDPAAAAAWVRENGIKFSEALTESTKCGILSGAVVVDPALAFKLIDELEIKDSGQAVTSIARAAKTAQERTATLVALRKHLPRIADESTRRAASEAAVQQLAFSSYKEGFDATQQWLIAAKLSPEESDSFLTTMAYANVKGNVTQWIDWLGENFPEQQANGRISLLVHDWALADYQAAGNWLAAAPAGSAKNAAIQMYATAVSKYEPEAAAQWAMTLPAGEDRDWTMKEIYQNWPKENPQGKEAFAKQHGLQKNSE
ncbi:MAG: hypothetical protein V4640_14795 [Verrucomicrobiota bacterium]